MKTNERTKKVKTVGRVVGRWRIPFVENAREGEEQERQGCHRGSSFPRTQPLAFGLLELLRGLRTALSQERLSPCSPLKSHHKEYPPSPFVSLPLLLCLSLFFLSFFLSLVPELHPLRSSFTFVLLSLPATVSPDVVDYRPVRTFLTFRSVGGNEKKKEGERERVGR